MNTFKKGDILAGNKRKFKEAYHPIVYINGPSEAPLAVVLTHSKNFSCNFKLTGTRDEESSYFIAHLIQKMSEWGPYDKEGELIKEELELVDKTISDMGSITWAEYVDYTKNGCPDHKKI